MNTMNTTVRKMVLVLVVLFFCATTIVQGSVVQGYGLKSVSYDLHGIGVQSHSLIKEDKTEKYNECVKRVSHKCQVTCTFPEGYMDLHCYEYCVEDICWREIV